MPIIVHYSHWSSQPDVAILCDGSIGVPAWGPRIKIPNIHQRDDDKFYTRRIENVTCPACFRMRTLMMIAEEILAKPDESNLDVLRWFVNKINLKADNASQPQQGIEIPPHQG